MKAIHKFISPMHDSRGLDPKIETRAYEIYEQRGKQGGHALDDWLQAEEEVLQATAKAAIHEMLLGYPPGGRQSASGRDPRGQAEASS
jgi:hypothetical protein